jgi:hypothetical protein
MNKYVFSKAFAQKLRGFVPARRADIMKAVERVLLDPRNNKYHRWYLDPYWQEHPSDTTLTIFFVPITKPPGRVFFVWVNDDRHPHDTHKNHGDDPCVKEFVRLRDAKPCLLEQYSEDEHEGKFTVNPRRVGPAYVTFEKYKVTVFSNVTHDGQTHFTMALASMTQPADLFDHYKIFIKKIREHYQSLKSPFEFRVPPHDTDFLNILRGNADPAHWNCTQDGGMDIWSIK